MVRRSVRVGVFDFAVLVFGFDLDRDVLHVHVLKFVFYLSFNSFEITQCLLSIDDDV